MTFSLPRVKKDRPVTPAPNPGLGGKGAGSGPSTEAAKLGVSHKVERNDWEQTEGR